MGRTPQPLSDAPNGSANAVPDLGGCQQAARPPVYRHLTFFGVWRLCGRHQPLLISAMKPTAITLIAALLALQSATLHAAGPSATTRVSVPGVSVERSSHHSTIEVSTPVGRASTSTTYNNGRAAFDRAYEQTMSTLRAGGGVANTGAQRASTTTTVSAGPSYAGFGVDRTVHNRSSTASAQEAALHMWDRTQHLRDLQSATESRRRP